MMEQDQRRNLLHCAIFEGISEETIQALCARARTVSFQAGDKLFERGQNADKLFILQDGVVELLFPVQIMGFSREVTMETKHAGDVVAWSALVSPFHFTLSARCASQCSLTSFSRDSLQAFFETDPQTGFLIMRNLAGIIGRRLHAMQTMWVHDLQSSAAKGLA